ncbi:STAS domain-containing protein [Cellulomonas marina]|uniref:STAS domain-containing protein n=1 Tax=Cellulomonas marina TaxID=988821 RepID=UPI001587D3A7|nr:STAS domain-containing protein [Cellulomonas marina]
MSDTAVGPLLRGVDVVIGLGRGDRPTAVAVRGVLDVHSCPTLRETLRSLVVAAGGGVVVDATELEVADEAGRAALDAVARHCREFGGSLVLPHAQSGRVGARRGVPAG